MTAPIPNEQSRELALAREMAAFPEMNPGPVIRTDRAGVIGLVNGAARALFAPLELPGANWRNVCPGLDETLWQRIAQGEDGCTHECQVAGRTFAFTYRRPSSIASVFIYGNDITERKRDELLLREQAERIAQMARFPDMNPGPVLRTDPEGTIVLANAAARALYGGEALIGRCWKDVLPELDQAAWTRILSDDQVVRVESRVEQQSFVFAHRRSPDARLVFIFGADVSALRATQQALRQSEKMATLGTLAAGVTHELNNPAAAATRSADQLRESLVRLQDAVQPISRMQLSEEQAEALRSLVRTDHEHGASALHLDPLTRSDLEIAIEDWLSARGIDEPWLLAPELVGLGYNVAELSEIADAWGSETPTVLRWIGCAQPVVALAREIGEATRRISEIVRALKSYSFLGQAPVRSVDVVEGIESTLVMLRSKLRGAITVNREYAPDVPPIAAYGSELNQLWTNLLDNAADALGSGGGEIAIRVKHDADAVVVEIEDDGPGMPEEVRQCVFDPFFTTKEPGKGTGLGLSTSRNIVVKKHGGTIDVASRPGSTRFTVRLPIQVPRLPENAEASGGGAAAP